MDESTVAIIAAGVSLLGAFITAAAASITSLRLARSQDRNEKRKLCLNLQQQFDSPAMFRHRYDAWKKIEMADLPHRITVRELFDKHWDESVSAVVHFFESLEQYCGQNLIDEDLAVALLGRPYMLWNDKLLSRLAIDDSSRYYLPWVTGVRAFGKRLHSSAGGYRKSAAEGQARSEEVGMPAGTQDQD